MDLYQRVRLACHHEGLSLRESARWFGIDRRKVKKMLSSSPPPGYRRAKPVRRPKRDRFIVIIDQILEENRGRPAKQRHTVKRIFKQLCDEYGFAGGITIVRDYVRARKRRRREVFEAPAHLARQPPREHRTRPL